VRDELAGMEIPATGTEDRRVLFDGSAREIARANLRLRAADRVFLRAASFDAPDFDALYEGVRAVPWRDLLGRSPAVTVNARSVKSRLAAVPSIQAVAQKAVVDSILGRAKARLEGTGPRCSIEIVLRNDRATISLNTSGPGLHRRGYRRAAGPAPLRETLAAGLVLLSRWDASRPLADPLCGSGTIIIEAALLAAHAAPGLGRSFAGEEWPGLAGAAWEEEREQARGARRAEECRITGSDRDARVVEMARRNARAAGVGDLASFHEAPLARFRPTGEYGCIVCNPPYGERLGDAAQAHAVYRELGAAWRGLPTWSLFALSAAEDFPRHFGARPSRNRKLYNGDIRCWLFQYFGPLPR
jgi:putative N6-adenine-specific DNA methylase